MSVLSFKNEEGLWEIPGIPLEGPYPGGEEEPTPSVKFKRLVVSNEKDSGADVIVTSDEDLYPAICRHFGYSVGGYSTHNTAVSGYHVILLSGNYKISSTFYLSGAVVEGESPEKTKITITSAGRFYCTGTPAMTLKNITLAASTTGSGTAISGNGGQNGLVVQNVIFEGFNEGIYLQGGSWRERVLNCYFYQCNTGVAVGKENYMLVHGCTFNSCTLGVAAGLKTICSSCHFVVAGTVGGRQGVKLTGGVVSGCTFSVSSSSQGGESSGVLINGPGSTVSGCKFKLASYSSSYSATAGIAVESSGQGSTITGSNFTWQYSGSQRNVRFISLVSSGQVSIVGNSFYPRTSVTSSPSTNYQCYAIYSSNSKNLTISDNSMTGVDYPVNLSGSHKGVIISDNHITYCWSGIVCSGSDVAVRGNIVGQLTESVSINLTVTRSIIDGNICEGTVSYQQVDSVHFGTNITS